MQPVVQDLPLQSSVPTQPVVASPKPVQRNIAVDAYRGLVMLLMMGEVLQLARVQTADRFAGVVPMPSLMAVDPEELVSTDWSLEWDADTALPL